MTKTFSTEQFNLTVTGRESVNDVRTTRVHVSDRFSHARHTVLRVATQAFLNAIEQYLKAHPKVVFDSKFNIARSLVYVPTGVRAWTAHMPGAFATYPVHNPDTKRIHNGPKLDIITRNLFRHSADGMGLRSRSYALAWLVWQRYGERATPLRWLSLGSGTGHQTIEAARVLKRAPEVWLTDIDGDVLDFAATLIKDEARPPKSHIERLDALDAAQLAEKLRRITPQVVDAMGLVEYLDDEQLVTFVRTIRRAAPAGCQFVFTNMRPTHPGLEVHRRGVGWPGVIVRSEKQVCKLMRQAGVPAKNIQVVLPDDHVYGIYEILT